MQFGRQFAAFSNPEDACASIQFKPSWVLIMPLSPTPTHALALEHDTP
jgi:hypothetical protein